jgi:hypothetical protein
MHITAQLEGETLRRLLDDILPITVLLDEEQALDGRWVRIDRAQSVEIVPGESLRLVSAGELRWNVGPVLATVTVHRLALMVRPLVTGEGASTRLLFRPRIEEADFRRMPAPLDRGIVAIVNRALERRGDALGWDVGRSLSRSFGLPGVLVPLETAGVDVLSAEVAILQDCIALTVSLAMRVSRSEAPRA